MSKYTPWFPGSVKPVHVGVYQRNYSASTFLLFCMWNGRGWMTANDSIGAAAKEGWRSINQSNVQWRGLAERPK